MWEGVAKRIVVIATKQIETNQQSTTVFFGQGIVEEGMNYCHEIFKLLEMKGSSEPPRRTPLRGWYIRTHQRCQG